MGDGTASLRAGAKRVALRLREAGHEAWFAGGCVRDLLLGARPKDWDIATDARPEVVQAIFPRTVAVGAAFGVIQVLEGRGRAYEVATFRAEGAYVDGRRPAEVHYSTSREEDVARRDFTVNALLMDPESEQVLDYVGGRADLEAGRIRAVGVAHDRFREDRLRMLRAVRFASRLDFEIEDATWSAIREEAPHIGVVSPERVTQELEGILGGPRPGEGLRLLEACGLARACLPAERDAALPEILDRLPGAAEALSAADRAAVGWALIHGELPRAELEPALRARKLSRAAIRLAQDLAATAELVTSALDEAPRAPILRCARGEAAEARGAYLWARFSPGSAQRRRWSAARAAVEAHPPAAEALLGGADLKAIGLRPGPSFKTVLYEVEAAALEGRATTRAEALEVARRAAERLDGGG